MSGPDKRSVSQRALVRDMPASEQPYASRYLVASDAHADSAALADTLEELKGTALERIKGRLRNELGPQPDTALTGLAKADPEFEEYVRKMVTARTAARKAFGRMRAVQMEFEEWRSKGARMRTEFELGKGDA